MSKEELFNIFKIMFPEWAERVVSYKKIGSKCLAIRFEMPVYKNEDPKDIISRVFLYYDPDNWQFGTKLWRKRPDRLNKMEDK